MSMYQELEARGYSFEPAPRTNPGAKLNEPHVLRRNGKIVLRGETRDDLEQKVERFLKRKTPALIAAEARAPYARKIQEQVARIEALEDALRALLETPARLPQCDCGAGRAYADHDKDCELGRARDVYARATALLAVRS